MLAHLPETVLTQLSEFVAIQMGLHFPPERWSELERGMNAAAREMGFPDVDSAVERLLLEQPGRRQVEVLASHLTVGETYFFRDKQIFQVFRDQILPELIRLRDGTDGRLRIWSAGCCTGEEPYSIAMVLTEMLPDVRSWNVTILGTDINPRFLEKAARGVYGGWSFRDAPSWVKERYFKRQKDEKFEIIPDLKKMVAFAYMNLVEDTYPSLVNNTNAMDVVFCRNVLMYFTPDRARKVIRSLHRSLVDGGWLIVSPTEASHVLFDQFQAVNFPGATLYRSVSTPKRTIQSFPDVPIYPIQEPTRDLPPSFEFSTIHSQDVPDIDDSGIGPAEVKKPSRPEPHSVPHGESLKLYEEGLYAEAAEAIVRLLPVNADDAGLMALLARIYANQGKLADASQWCEKAIAGDKLNPAYRYLLATIMQEQGRLGDAVQSLMHAVYLNQDFVLAHFALGNMALRRGRSGDARKHFQNALMLLRRYRPDQPVPESEGVPAGRLIEIINATQLGQRES